MMMILMMKIKKEFPMKKIISRVFTLASAILIVGCSQEEVIDPSELSEVRMAPSITVNFRTVGSTRTAFQEYDESSDSYPAVWTVNDETIRMSLNYATPVEATVNKEEETSSYASFTGTFEDTGSPYRFFALSPKSAVIAISPSRESWSVTIPTEQTPTEDGLSCDEAAQLIYAVSDELTTIPDPVDLYFYHITTYCRLTLKNLEDAFTTAGVSDAEVTSIDVTFGTPVAGDWYYDFEDQVISEKDASHTIRINTTTVEDVWFALAPCDLGGQTLKVTVNTSAGHFSRTVTFPEGRTYTAGNVNKLSISMKKAEFEEVTTTREETVYSLVKDLSSLSSSDEVIIMNAVTPTTAMGSGSSFNAVSGTSNFTYTSSDGYVRLPDGSSVTVFTITKSSSTLTFKTGSSYLAVTGQGGGRSLTTSTTATSWTASIATTGLANIYYKGKQKSYYITAGSSAYSINSSTATVTLWKKTTVTVTAESDPDSDAILQSSVYGAYLSSGNIVYSSGTAQLSREYLSESVTFAILFPSSNTILEFNGIPLDAAKRDTFTLSLVKIIGRKQTLLGEYEVMVVKEDGAKLWLSDFSGNGFIVKR